MVIWMDFEEGEDSFEEEAPEGSVGAQFGEQALDETVTAGLIGVALVFICRGSQP